MFTPQLFDISKDSFEMNSLLNGANDVSADVLKIKRSTEAVLEKQFDYQAVDKKVKLFQRNIFVDMVYDQKKLVEWSAPGVGSVFHDSDFIDAQKTTICIVFVLSLIHI